MTTRPLYLPVAMLPIISSVCAPVCALQMLNVSNISAFRNLLYITFKNIFNTANAEYFGKQSIYDLMDVIKKHKTEKFLVPCSDIAKQEITEVLKDNDIEYTKAVIYKTVCSNLSDLAEVNYDMIVFFSPSGITSLFKNFPKFKQKETRIAAFGTTTSQSVIDAGLRLDVKAPVPRCTLHDNGHRAIH